jgi:phage baseplate assembly protein gpV
LKEADRCRAYLDPVLNEQVIVVLADELLRLQELT